MEMKRIEMKLFLWLLNPLEYLIVKPGSGFCSAAAGRQGRI
jgi:hypothetical protein